MGPSQPRARGFGSNAGWSKPLLPWHLSTRKPSQQLNKVSFICDTQIQPMQKKITFPIDSSDNKLLKKKKKIYIYQEGILSPKFPLKKPKKQNKKNPGRVKKNHTHVMYISDINENNLK